MFISLICNSSSLSSFSDLLRKKKNHLKIHDRWAQRPWRIQNLCIFLQACCVIHVLFFTVRREIPWEMCPLHEKLSEKCQRELFNFSMNLFLLGCRPLTNFGQCPIVSQVLGSVMQTHPSDSTCSQCGSDWAYWALLLICQLMYAELPVLLHCLD